MSQQRRLEIVRVDAYVRSLTVDDREQQVSAGDDHAEVMLLLVAQRSIGQEPTDTEDGIHRSAKLV